MTLKLVSYNIRKGRGPHQRRGCLQTMRRELAQTEADVILCQEVYHDWDEAGHRQADWLSQGLEFEHAYGRNAVYRRGHHGNATLTRHAIRENFNRDLSTNPLERRGVLYARLEIGGSPLHVFNTHLGLNRGQRVTQVRRVGQMIEQLSRDGAPVLLAGDFNDWTGSLDREVRRRCRLQNAFDILPPGDRRSWPNFRPMFPLDRIYYRGLELRSAGVLRDDPWRRLSDHLPIFAEFRRPS
jgi:endonuclease/exonuclease/phosphatase family metal-dependent hydrolase